MRVLNPQPGAPQPLLSRFLLLLSSRPVQIIFSCSLLFIFPSNKSTSILLCSSCSFLFVSSSRVRSSSCRLRRRLSDEKGHAEEVIKCSVQFAHTFSSSSFLFFSVTRSSRWRRCSLLMTARLHQTLTNRKSVHPETLFPEHERLRTPSFGLLPLEMSCVSAFVLENSVRMVSNQVLC